MTEELSFAPDRRSVQATFYHFSDRPSGLSDSRNFSQHDTLIIALDKIYQTKFKDLLPEHRRILVSILTSEVPLDHRNLTFLAIANYIVYNIRATRREFTPDIFEMYFNDFSSFIMTDVGTKQVSEIEEIRARFKATLLRYIFYFRDNTTDFTKSS